MDDRSLHSLPDDELLTRLEGLLRTSRHTEADLVAHIAEVDARKLYAREACPSMWAYCTEVLHLSEAEAYLRIAAGRASREHPLLLEMLADGRLHLSAIGKLAPYLTRVNAGEVLARAAHKTKGQILELIAELFPRPEARTMVRRLPDRGRPVALGGDFSSPGEESEAGNGRPRERLFRPDRVTGTALDPAGVLGPEQVTLRPEVVPTTVGSPSPVGHSPVSPMRLLPVSAVALSPLSPGRYKIQFTASTTFKEKLERLQALMPQSDLAAALETAVSLTLERLEARRFARTDTLRKGLSETTVAPKSRPLPAAVRRAVHERDGGRCRFVDERGRRCRERRWLEFHHRHPYGYGGDHRPSNVSLLCRVHHQLMTEHDYGRKRWRAGGPRERSPVVPPSRPLPNGTNLDGTATSRS